MNSTLSTLVARRLGPASFPCLALTYSWTCLLFYSILRRPDWQTILFPLPPPPPSALAVLLILPSLPCRPSRHDGLAAHPDAGKSTRSHIPAIANRQMLKLPSASPARRTRRAYAQNRHHYRLFQSQRSLHRQLPQAFPSGYRTWYRRPNLIVYLCRLPALLLQLSSVLQVAQCHNVLHLPPQHRPSPSTSSEHLRVRTTSGPSSTPSRSSPLARLIRTDATRRL